MDMHELQNKYRGADFWDISNDADYKRAFYSLKLFEKGDFGMLIVPPETEEFALAIAVSTCGLASDRVGSLKVPKLKSCIFVDTVSKKNKLAKDVLKAESYIDRPLPQKFAMVTAKDINTSNVKYPTFGEENGDEGLLDCISKYIENKHDEVDGIFITLDSVIFLPNNFQKSKFDKFIEWALKLKSQGKTLIVMTQYQIPQTKYLTNHMDFAINCIPDQLGAAYRVCSFSVQWLHLRSKAAPGTAELSKSRLVNKESLDVVENPYFRILSFIWWYGKRGWSRRPTAMRV